MRMRRHCCEGVRQAERQPKYVTGYGGNLAWKLEEDVILTPTKMNKGDITPKDLVFINRAGDTR